MKKTILVIICGLLGGLVYAQNPLSASLTIKITSEWSGGDVLVFMEKSTYSDTEADYGADVPKLSNTGEGSINLYGIVGANHYSTVAKEHLEGSMIGLVTNEFDTHYDIKFTGANYTEGRDTLYLEDLEKDTLIKIVKNATYSIDFETAAIRTLNNRFRIYKPSAPTICHQYGKLLITGHVGDKVKVLDMEGEVAIAEQTISTDNTVINLASLTKNKMYQVVIGDKTMIIKVQ